MAQGRSQLSLTRITAVLGSTLLALLIAVSAAAARRHPACGSPGATRLLDDTFVTVYRTPLRTLHTVGLAGSHFDTVYACWEKTGKRTRLVQESPDDYGSVELDAIKQPDDSGSPMIAFTTTSVTRSGTTDKIESLNVRTGQRVHSNAANVAAYQRLAVNLSIQEFLVTPAGSLAWIGQGNCPHSRNPGYTLTGVYAIATTGREQAEQCGARTTADPDSGPAQFAGLRFDSHAGRLSWLSQTGLQTAKLR